MTRYFVIILVVVFTIHLTVCFAENEAKGSWMSSLKDRLFSFVKSGATKENVPPSPKIAAADLKKMILDAESKIASSEIPAALDILTSVLSSDPNNQRANALIGAILLSFQQFNMAETVLFQAVKESNWTDVNSIVNLATTLRFLGDGSLSLKTLVKGYSTGNNSVDSKGAFASAFGQIYLNLTDYQKASEWFLVAAGKTVQDEDLWLTASTLRFPNEHVNYKVAESVLLEAVNANKKSSTLVFNLGLVMFATGRIQEAITFYEQAIRLDGQNNDAIGALATALHSIKRHDEAFYYYNIATSRNPSNAVLLANFAMLLKDVGRNSEGIQIVTKAFEMSPNNPSVLRAIRELGLVVTKA